MNNEQTTPETKGVTVNLLSTLDLGPEIEGMAGRQLRMRMVMIEPGGVFGPIHDHKDRPGMVYILQGTIDQRDGVATEYGPGVGWPEDKNTLHWLENQARYQRWRSQLILSGKCKQTRLLLQSFHHLASMPSCSTLMLPKVRFSSVK